MEKALQKWRRRERSANARKSSTRPKTSAFTCRDNVLYATFLGWPGDKAVIGFDQEEKSFFKTIKLLEPGEVESVQMLGVDQELDFEMTRRGLEIDTPDAKPCDSAFVFKITRKDPF